MRTGVAYLAAGVVLGAGSVWLVRGGVPSVKNDEVAKPEHTVCDQELARMRQRVTELEGQVRSLTVAEAKLASSEPKIQSTPLPAAGESGGESPQAPPAEDESIRWRVSAIEKFVSLNDEQRRRLQEKYEAERKARESGEEAKTESLEEILGDESARYYREQIQAAFKRVQDEEVEREVVWLSRQLSLSGDQETAVRKVLADIDGELRQGGTHGQGGGSPQERIKGMIAENRRRAQLRAERLRQILTPDQFEAFLRSEAESSAADVEVFHDPGDGAATPAP